MLTKKAYTLEQVILYLEALEMLDMVYKVEKFPYYKDHETGLSYWNLWIIEYEPSQPLEHEKPDIQYED